MGQKTSERPVYTLTVLTGIKHVKKIFLLFLDKRLKQKKALSFLTNTPYVRRIFTTLMSGHKRPGLPVNSNFRLLIASGNILLELSPFLF